MSGAENQRFKGKTVIVTGGTSGIGLATARRMLREGATVIVTHSREASRSRAEPTLPGAEFILDDPSASARRDGYRTRHWRQAHRRAVPERGTGDIRPARADHIRGVRPPVRHPREGTAVAGRGAGPRPVRRGVRRPHHLVRQPDGHGRGAGGCRLPALRRSAGLCELLPGTVMTLISAAVIVLSFWVWLPNRNFVPAQT